jgi:2,3-bisphosphoglycerate-dependent phosphoglycerate mutase
MKRAFILIGFILGSFISVSAQQKLTTFILIRHAEKMIDATMSNGSKDPNLSDVGKKRAENLVSVFRNTAIRAIYSTAFIRTRDTVTPLAKAKSIAITEYDAFKPEVIDKILKDFNGETVLICGHSNNIPWIANYLTGAEKLKSYDEADYGNVLIVSVAEIGKATSVTWLYY